MPVMKSVAWVRSNARVTVVVPKSQRTWNRLVYERPPKGGLHAVTLRACRKFRSRRAQRRECGWPRPWSSYKACRRPYTEFNGGVGIDFAEAPNRGLCAEVIVWVEGRKEPLRRRLFRPGADECRESADRNHGTAAAARLSRAARASQRAASSGRPSVAASLPRGHAAEPRR
jgi:hypothetical protein